MGGLTIEQIKEGGSKIRNRCIAEVFSRMKIIESWGTGIKRMYVSQTVSSSNLKSILVCPSSV